MAKDDVSPQDIFRMSKESASSRAIVAKYCIQDCNLVHHLMTKVDILTGYIEMARICSVPINFLVFRGQGIKLTSYVAKVCREKQTLMPDLEKTQNDDGYEGAIVLPPKCAMYGENPVACVDYSSLYPSIAKGWNLSPNSKVWTKNYDLDGNLVKINDQLVTAKNRADLETQAYQYDNMPGYQYVEVTFDSFETRQKMTATGKEGKKEKTKSGTKVCRWAQFPNNQEGIIPCIIGHLLKARKETRVKAESESDPFIANILDKRQLGYKVTANSLYGQMGSSVSTFFEKDVAASITAIGRMMIIYAKRMVEEVYGDSIYTSKSGETVRTRSAYVYGDTDSVFFTFNLEEIDTGAPIRGKRALELTIEIAQEAAKLCSLFLPPPMALAYEKTLMNFILLSKKRYVGILYEFNPNKGKLKFMGLPLKRRDSCDYLKDVYGGILTILMKEPDNIEKAIEFLNTSLKSLVDGKVSMEKLALTKSLRSDYKNPAQIAHKVLAERIGERDPGNKPKPGDRIKYVFVENKDGKKLLGERIETPQYIIQNKLPLDYHYYITNQLMNPLQQLFSLAVEKIYLYKGKKQKDIGDLHKTLDKLFVDSHSDLEIFMKKREKHCSGEVKKLLFDPFLNEIYNAQNGIQTLFQFYKRAQTE
jgi:DNA polymerase elongation subunit (family B)